MEGWQKKIKFRKVFIIILLFLLILWLAIVFLFSSQSGRESSKVSDKVTRQLLEIKDSYANKNISNKISNLRVDKWELLVRKLAHYFLFAFGGVVIYLSLTMIKQSKNTYLIAIFLGMLFACIDEYHQLYSLNRGPRLVDVGIDTLGIISGVIFAMIFIKIIKKGEIVYDRFKKSNRRKNFKSS